MYPSMCTSVNARAMIQNDFNVYIYIRIWHNRLLDHGDLVDGMEF